MRVNNSTGKGTPGMDKISSEDHRVHMELGGKLLYSLKIKTQFLEGLQSVSVIDGGSIKNASSLVQQGMHKNTKAA